MLLKAMTANIRYGGINRENGDNRDALLTLERILEEAPDILAMQEMYALDASNIRRQLRWWSSQLDMYAFLGPSANIGSVAGTYNAIFVRESRGIQVTDEWPGPLGKHHPFCRVELDIPGLGRPVQVTCAHLAARTIIRRREAAEIIGSYSADAIDKGEHVIVAGDFNGFPRFGADINLMPPRLLSARAVRDDNKEWHPDFTADDALTGSGLEDLGGLLSVSQNDPDHAAPTGIGGVRVDRIYADTALSKLAAGYRRFEIASDHNAVGVIFDIPDLIG